MKQTQSLIIDKITQLLSPQINFSLKDHPFNLAHLTLFKLAIRRNELKFKLQKIL